MKKQVIAVLLVIFLGAGRLSAQEKDTIITLPTITVNTGTVVNAEVNKSFKKAFPNAQNLRWYKLNKNYLAKFIESDMKHQALFTKKGNLTYDISYGYENQLPEDVRNTIVGTYPDYKITSAANVKQANRNIWVVNLESLNNLVLARVEDGVMDEVERYKKSM